MFKEDVVPACRCTAHPLHEDKRKWMKVVKITESHVVWCCQRCTEIAKVPTIQVRVLPRGKDMARMALYELEKRRLLGSGQRPRIGRVTVREEQKEQT